MIQKKEIRYHIKKYKKWYTEKKIIKAYPIESNH